MSDFQIDDEHPETSIPTPEQQIKKPLEFGYLLQDMLDKAQAATKRGDHMSAARYYAALTKAVPMRAYAFGMTCASLEAAGQIAKAVGACRIALTREGVTVGDYQRFVRLVLAKSGPLTAEENKELAETVDHLSKQPDVGLVPDQLRCGIALRNKDVPALESCTAALAKAAPNDAGTISFQWALAVEKRDRKQAQQLVDRARKAGMAPEGLTRMEQTTRALGGFRASRPLLWGLGAALAVAGVFAARARRLRLRTSTR